MLIKINIKSFVIFNNYSLEFQDGMTAITGTTGSGKSVIFDAIEFALGNKITRTVKSATVELIFKKNNEIIELRHSKDNVSKFYVNGILSSRTKVQDLARTLICCQRQNQHLQSLESYYQRLVLDQYANIDLTQVNHIYDCWQELRKSISDKNKEIIGINYELSQHYLSELDCLNPSVEDWLSLNEKLKNNKQGKRLQADNNKSQALVSQVLTNLEELINLQFNQSNINKCLLEAQILIQESCFEIEQLNSQSELSEHELQIIEERIQEYFRLARKHKTQPELLTEVQTNYRHDCDMVEQIRHELVTLNNKLKKIQSDWYDLAKEISVIRHNKAQELAKLMQEKLQQLNMQINIKLDFSLLAQEIAPDGGGLLEFMVATKANQPLKPVAKVLSGGEAARLALVMQELLSAGTTDMTYLMDEVDVGVSGAVASSIGGLLKKMSVNNQVFSITHTPQVAALAKHHISMSEARRFLSYDERVAEIAAMLCHDGITESAKKQAEALLA